MGFTTVPGADGEHITYCRICEALCGMVATVDRGRITRIRPDADNPHSRGHICVKGPALAELAYDEDRITRPMKRTGAAGDFTPVSWDEALGDIAARLSAIVETHGAEAFAMNTGNPPSMGWPSAMGNALFQQAMGCTRLYSPSSEDISTPVLATELMFGTHAFVFPDLAACDHLLIFGSNPLVSHGSLLIAPRFKEDLDAIAARGRVIVIDPRRSETARKFEHVSIIPEGDVWLLAAMLSVIHAEGLEAADFVADQCSGWPELATALATITPEQAAPLCGIEADAIRTLARDFAAAPRAAAMGRIGICRGQYSTLTNFLLHALNVVCGRFHAEGGIGWGHGGSATDEPFRGISPMAARGGVPSRVSGIPSVWGAQSSLTLLEEMITPGPGQIRALLLSGANPVMSMPGGPALPQGFARLDLMVSLDLYMNESNAHAHYILPVTTALERADINQFFMNHMVRPFAQHVAAVLPPVGEARMEYDILRDLAARMGRDAPFGTMTPFDMADAALKAGVEGLSLEAIKAHPHGLMIERGRWAFDWKSRMGHADGRIRLYPALIAEEIARLISAPPRNPDALRLINLRRLKSINSWMNNVDGLARSNDPVLLIHPQDAAARGVQGDATVSLRSAWGEIVVQARITDEVRPGCVAYPHGRGNDGGWTRAAARPGANLNRITPNTPDMAEPASGMSWLEGFDVEVAAL
jgi:formate dehydrogenase